MLKAVVFMIRTSLDPVHNKDCCFYSISDSQLCMMCINFNKETLIQFQEADPDIFRVKQCILDQQCMAHL